MTDHYRGFDHPVIDVPDEATTDLFSEMDQIADDLRKNPMHIAAYDMIAFRQLQTKRRGDLTKQQSLDLFEVWRERYAAKMKAERDEAVRFITRFSQAAARIAPPGAAFNCVCGEEGDPNDPEFERIHRPHVCLAGLDNVKSFRIARWIER